MRGTLVCALDELAQRMAAGRPIRRVVLETTALEDPAPILQALMSEPSLRRTFAQHSVTTVVDAMAGPTFDTQVEALTQAAMADRPRHVRRWWRWRHGCAR